MQGIAHDNPDLRGRRCRRGWTQAELADRLREAAAALGEAFPMVDDRTVRRWESGETRPGAYYTRLLCRVFELTPDELGLTREVYVPADSSDLGPEVETAALVRRILQTDLGEGSLESVHHSVHRLCCEYSTRPPAIMIPAVQDQLREIHDFLGGRLSLAQHSQLVNDAGWLYMLLTCLHNDLGHRRAAWRSRDAALWLAQESKDGNLVSWAFETPSWFALFDNDSRTALDYAEEGVRVAPMGSSGWLMNALKVASAHARQGDRFLVEKTLERASAVLAQLPPPERPDHHFVFDPPKFDFYAATLYAWLGLPEETERHAREVIRRQNDPRTHDWNPTRVAISRVDLAQALLEQGRLEEAIEEAALTFRTFPRRDTVVRAEDLSGLLLARYPDLPEASRFHEEVREAKRALAAPA